MGDKKGGGLGEKEREDRGGEGERKEKEEEERKRGKKKGLKKKEERGKEQRIGECMGMGEKKAYDWSREGKEIRVEFPTLTDPETCHILVLQ